MKKIQLLIGTAIVAASFVACSDSSTVQKDAENLSQYVDSVDQLEPIYTEANWKTIDEGYQDRNMKVEKNSSTMQADDKEKVESAHVKYAALKTKYETKIDEKKKTESEPPKNDNGNLRKALFNDKLGADMSFAWMTAGNVVETYQNFVDAVENHKNDYSKEDWDQVKVMYAALDARKETLDKDISVKDRLKIAGLKTKYKAIKAVHRPLADSE